MDKEKMEEYELNKGKLAGRFSGLAAGAAAGARAGQMLRIGLCPFMSYVVGEILFSVGGGVIGGMVGFVAGDKVGSIFDDKIISDGVKEVSQ